MGNSLLHSTLRDSSFRADPTWVPYACSISANVLSLVSTTQKIMNKTLKAQRMAKKENTTDSFSTSTALGKEIVTVNASSQLTKAALDDAAPFKRVGKISPM